MSSNAIFYPSIAKTEQTTQTFLQTLSDTNPDPKQENTVIYVHPLVRQSSAKLSTRSLEMCTEGLGSETGCDIMEEMLFDTSSSMIHKKCTKSDVKAKRECKYPPPLTSISNSISVETYREKGRLVVNVVVFMESSNSLFQAERVDGRLTLRFKKGDQEEDEFDGIDGGDDEDGSDASVFCCEDLFRE